MAPIVTWSIVGAGAALALVMIGFRNWGGWLLLAIATVVSLVYAAVTQQSTVVHILNIVVLAISVFFSYRWGSSATSEAE
ncbi:MAG TPA: hypothetical protein VLJ88_08630 [Propionibacteriaceae bacterium]|nr:hypothetical protein [Propionibacteriaceae bacterium]